MKYVIRKAMKTEWDESMALAWKTFMHFDAKDYTKEGVDSFLDFISDTGLNRMFHLGTYKVYVAVCEDKIIGVISIRQKKHISLLFVDEKYHKQGVGRALIRYAAKAAKAEEGVDSCTVNAAPYAVEFYHKLGFVDTGEETVDAGIRYTPMIYNILTM